MADLAIFAGCMVPGSILAYTDAKYHILKNKLTLPLIVLGLIYSAFQGHIKTSLWGLLFGFLIIFVFALLGGIAGGDVKLAAGLGAWFGYPDIAYIIFIGSLGGAFWGAIKLYKMGVLKERMVVFFRGAYIRLAYGTKGIMALPKLPEEGIPEESIPYGTFMIIGTWIVFLKEVISCLY